MSQHSSTTSDRERVCAEAQLARAAEQSRHEISKLALKLLQQRLDAQHLVNVENRQRAIALVEDKLSTGAAKLAVRHDWEVTELEDAKFALFEEFDKRRVAWASTIGATTQLADEASKHAALVETTMADKLREDDAAKQKLQNTIDKLGRTFVGSLVQRIERAHEQAATSQVERERIHADRLANLEASWQERQLELDSTVYLGKFQHRPTRLKLEDEYQTRLGELAQQQEAVRLRQKRELETLAELRISAHAGVLSASEAADADLLDERKRVDEWWNSLLNEAAARQQQIDKDEQRALDKIDSAEASNMTQMQKATGASETDMAAAVVEVSNTTDAAAENPQRTSTAEAAAVNFVPSRRQRMTSEQTQVFEFGAATGHEGADTAATGVSAATTQQMHTPTEPPFGADTSANDTREGDTVDSPFGLVRNSDELDTLHIDDAFATPIDSTTLIPDIESYQPSGYEPAGDAGSPYIGAEVEAALDIQERSGSPDSAGSDFIEI